MANNRSTNNKTNLNDDFDFFDGNFEVTYIEDLPDLPDYTDEKDDDDYEDVLSCLSEVDEEDARERRRRRERRERASGDRFQDSERREAFERRSSGRDASDRRDSDRRDSSRKKKRRLPNLASPVAKTAKSGGKLIYKICNLLLQGATLILIAVIFYRIAITFWSNHSALGTLPSIVNDKNYTLAAFLGVGLFLLLFELISFLIVLMSSKKGDRKGRPVDRGRGLFSFIFIGGCSYLAWMLNTLIPTSPAPLQGVRDALFVYGSMHSALSALCIAGIVSCLIRKFLIR